MIKIKLRSRGADNWLEEIKEGKYLLHSEYDHVRVIFDKNSIFPISIDPPDGPMMSIGDKIPEIGTIKKIINCNGFYIITDKFNPKPEEPYDLYGIECGKGWNKLITPILDYIDIYNSGQKDEDKIQVYQIKEKFGGLRIYVSYTTPELEKMIKEAEDQSYKVCEYCGSTDNVQQTKTGWIKTLCEKCRKG